MKYTENDMIMFALHYAWEAHDALNTGDVKLPDALMELKDWEIKTGRK